MDFHVRLIGRTNRTTEIYQQVRKAIVDGLLRPGDRLPPTRELARSLGVSRTTVTVAFDRLVAEGYATSRVGAGTFVNAHAARSGGDAKRGRSRGVLRPASIWDGVPLPSAFDRPVQFDFRTGLPDGALFPYQEWGRLVSRQFRQEARGFGIYGHPAGHRGLREAIARHVGVSRGLEVMPEDITITCGTQQAIDIVARALLAPGDVVAVEDPGYPPPIRLFHSLGLRIHAAPVDRDGMIVSALPRNARMVYVTPSHQYPLGVAMTLARRRELLAWAERNDAAILEDDYDTEFRFGGRPIEPLQTLDTSGRVIYAGTFSKTLLPTLRLGFVVSPASLIEAIHKAKFVTDWHTPLILQATLARFLDNGGFARHVRRMNGVYQTRREMMLNFLNHELADYFDVQPSVAGLHFTAVARDSIAKQMPGIVSRAFDGGIGVQELSTFAINSARYGLVLGYGAIPTALIPEGLRRLRSCFYDQLPVGHRRVQLPLDGYA